MGIFIQYLLHFSVPLLIHFTDTFYLGLIPWLGSIAFSLLFRGKKDFFPKRPRLDTVLAIVAIFVSVTIATYIPYKYQIEHISLETGAYYLLLMWRMTPLFFMINKPFIFSKKDPKS
ncbi:MAG: hypothetical protein Q4E37_04160 [Tissierellia bacterium]|nr:hypothetical protein [Tissierellia bacterium]